MPDIDEGNREAHQHAYSNLLVQLIQAQIVADALARYTRERACLMDDGGEIDTIDAWDLAELAAHLRVMLRELRRGVSAYFAQYYE